MNEEMPEKSMAQPEEIPKDTYRPFLLAVSLLFMGWGLISYWLLSLAGSIAFFMVLSGWIIEMLHDEN